tara:strand:+ start:6939 stop:7184 length:246 start_codon:yes stop_codon:yes gene_type:complete
MSFCSNKCEINNLFLKQTELTRELQTAVFEMVRQKEYFESVVDGEEATEQYEELQEEINQLREKNKYLEEKLSKINDFLTL